MEKKSITKNYIFNLVYQLLLIIMPIITTPYLSRVLGAENIGIYSYTLSITTYFILIGSLGVSLYGQREIAYLQDKAYERSKTFIEIFIMKLLALSVSLIIFYFTFCLNGDYSLYYKILILEIIANIIDISWFFQGLEEFKKTVSRNIIVKLISVLLIFILVKSSNDLSKYFAIYVLSTFLGNFSMWIYLPKYLQRVNLKKLNIFKHLKPTIILFIPQIATQIYTVLDKTMMGTIIADKSEVGFYEQSQKIIKILMSISTSLGTVMVPRIAAIYASGNKEKLRKYMDNSFSFIMLLSFPLMFGISSIANHFVPVFFGSGYDKVKILLIIISPIIVFIGLSNVIGNQYFLPTKQQGKFTFSVVVGAIVNIVLNLILIPKWKSVGASIATVIAEFIVTTTQIVLIRKEISILDILKLSYKYIISSIIMFICSILIGHFIANDILSIIIQVSASCFIYFGLLLLLKDQMIFKGKEIIINKFNKFKEVN